MIQIIPIAIPCRQCLVKPGESCVFSPGPDLGTVEFHAFRVRDAAAASEIVADLTPPAIAIDDLFDRDSVTRTDIDPPTRTRADTRRDADTATDRPTRARTDLGKTADARRAADAATGQAVKEIALLFRGIDAIRAGGSISQTGDGYHTFAELYAHRFALYLSLCARINASSPPGHVWRSKLHSDGSKLDGWFVLGIGVEPGKQITYHLPLERWSDADFLGQDGERELAPTFDGHTGADVIERLGWMGR